MRMCEDPKTCNQCKGLYSTPEELDAAFETASEFWRDVRRIQNHFPSIKDLQERNSKIVENFLDKINDVDKIKSMSLGFISQGEIVINNPKQIVVIDT